MNRVVVTGAGGFLGRHVVDALAARGFEVHALTRRTSSPPAPIPGRAHWHTIDLFDPLAVHAAFHTIRPQGLVHLAWDTTPGVYWNSSANEAWKDASLALFDGFARSGGGRIVVAGTSAEYAWTSPTLLDESHSPLRSQSLYGIMKNRLRENLEQWAPSAGISWAWGRIFNIFGPHERSARLVPKTILTLLAGRHLPFDSGLLVRDFLFVADAADAFAALYESSFTGAVNIASGEGITIRELLTTIAETLNCRERIAFCSEADRTGEAPYVVGSPRVLHEAVGWSGGLGWREGIKQTCAWWQHFSEQL